MAVRVIKQSRWRRHNGEVEPQREVLSCPDSGLRASNLPLRIFDFIRSIIFLFDTTSILSESAGMPTELEEVSHLTRVFSSNHANNHQQSLSNFSITATLRFAKLVRMIINQCFSRPQKLSDTALQPLRTSLDIQLRNQICSKEIS
jgi:hypothetical protein